MLEKSKTKLKSTQGTAEDHLIEGPQAGPRRNRARRLPETAPARKSQLCGLEASSVDGLCLLPLPILHGDHEYVNSLSRAVNTA